MGGEAAHDCARRQRAPRKNLSVFLYGSKPHQRDASHRQAGARGNRSQRQVMPRSRPPRSPRRLASWLANAGVLMPSGLATLRVTASNRVAVSTARPRRSLRHSFKSAIAGSAPYPAEVPARDASTPRTPTNPAQEKQGRQSSRRLSRSSRDWGRLPRTRWCRNWGRSETGSRIRCRRSGHRPCVRLRSAPGSSTSGCRYG